MSQGFRATNKCIEERDRALRQLKLAQEENRLLRKVLSEIRPMLITDKHKQLVDKVLRARSPS